MIPTSEMNHRNRFVQWFPIWKRTTATIIGRCTSQFRFQCAICRLRNGRKRRSIVDRPTMTATGKAISHVCHVISMAGKPLGRHVYYQKYLTGWWYTYPSEKYESHMGLLYIIVPNIWKKNPNVPNHQPVDDEFLMWNTPTCASSMDPVYGFQANPPTRLEPMWKVSRGKSLGLDPWLNGTSNPQLSSMEISEKLNNISMDCFFWGKSTGNHHFYHLIKRGFL